MEQRVICAGVDVIEAEAKIEEAAGRPGGGSPLQSADAEKFAFRRRGVENASHHGSLHGVAGLENWLY